MTHVAGKVCPPGVKCNTVRCLSAGRDPITPDHTTSGEPGILKWATGTNGERLLVPAPETTDNYTCTRCGNKKLCTHTDKSCWSCGETVQK